MKSLLLSHPDCNHHRMPNHPERPERLIAVMERLEQCGLAATMEQVSASEIDTTRLSLVHPEEYIKGIETAEQAGALIRLDADTFMSEGSTRAAKLAAGAVAEGLTRVLDGATRRSFCAVRPPGHHAEIAESLGFCLFNNIAVGATLALQDPQINRVAILDFDVHHCNGTVDIFKGNADVLVCSSFQEDFYPYRYLDYQNDHVINTPLAVGTSSNEFRRQIAASWPRAVELFEPDIIFISAGFDAHKNDPLAQVRLETEDYRWITRLIIDLADQFCGGRIVSTLEGGYDLQALTESVQVHVEELAS